MKRKGYMYAIEGVIASLLVLIYIGSIISAPSPTDWSNTAISKRSSDFLESLSRAGWLDKSVARYSPEIISGISNSMETGMSYSMYVSGVPASSVSVSLLMNDSDIYRAGSQVNSSLNASDGLPEPYSVYRSGEILGTSFVLSDAQPDGKTVYNAVSFDLNEDGNYSSVVEGAREGTYVFGDTLDACLNERCGKFYIGYMNDTLTLYSMESYENIVDSDSITAGSFKTDLSYSAQELRPEIDKEESDFQQDGATWKTKEEMNGVDIGIIAVNRNSSVRFNISSRLTPSYNERDIAVLMGGVYSIDSIMPFKAVPTNRIDSDILLAKDVPPKLLDIHNETIKSFLSQDNVLIEMLDLQDWDIDRFEGSLQNDIGLKWRDLPLDRGLDVNRFSSEEIGELTRDYYSSIDISVDQSRYSFHPKESNWEYAVANMSLRGQNVTVNSSQEDIVEIQTDRSEVEELRKGEKVSVTGNLYTVKDAYPLKLSASADYSFRDFHGGKIIGERNILYMPGWRWDKEAGSFNVSLKSIDRPSGAPDTNCDSSNNYFNGSFSFRGIEYSVLATNRDSSCDNNFEYFNFDFNRNNRFNDSELGTGSGYSSEGIHQNNEKVDVDGVEFRIRASGSNWTYIERQVKNRVGSLVQSSGVQQGNGKVFFSGNVDLGDDDTALLKAVLMRSSADRRRFTETLSIGSSASGLTYSGNIQGEFSTPYVVDSAWWFQ